MIKKLLFFSGIILFSVTNAYGQTFTNCITLSETGVSVRYPLWYGMDPAALDTEDDLDEVADAPPPTPAFFAKISNAGQSYFKDIRKSSYEETIFKIEFTREADRADITFTWASDSLPPGEFILYRKIIVEVVNVDMKAQNSYTLPLKLITFLELKVTLPPNHPPVIAFETQTVGGTVGIPLEFTVTAADTDGDIVTFAFTGTLPGGVTATTDGVISGTPTDSGSFPLFITATDGRGGADTAAVRLEIDPVPVDLEIMVKPLLLSFGNVIIGQSAQDTITISNIGTSDLTVDSITAPTGFTVSPMSATIAAHDSQVVTVTFSPIAEVNYSGNIVINSDDEDEPTVNIAITGTGIVPIPEIDVTPITLSFGDVNVSQSAQDTITISNPGTSDLIVTGIAVPIGFAVIPTQVMVQPGGSQVVTVTFSPIAEVNYSGNIVINSNDADEPQVNVAVTGTGVAQGASKLIFAEAGVVQDTLHFGIHPNGTDGIDAGLGEIELDLKPPAGNFDVRFTGTGLGNGLKIDIRDNTTVQKVYIIEIQRAAGGDITISWGDLPPGQFILQDLFGGFLGIDVDMTTTNSATIQTTSITSVKLLVTPVVNHPPVIAFETQTVEGTVRIPLEFTVTATDADGDTVTFAFTGTLPGGVTATTDGVISGTPTESGFFPLFITAADGKGGADTAAVTLIISRIFNVPADYSTIQEAIDIDAVVNGDTVLVQPGTYVENINLKGKNIVVGSLLLTTGDTTYISQTIIDGNQNGSVVTFNNGEDLTAVLIGFTITNGSASEGGGILCDHSNPILSNLTISGNSASYIGGGIHFKANSNAILSNATIHGNSSNDAGGIGFSSSSPTLVNIIISGNTAKKGGGICCFTSSNPNLYNVKIKGNTADEHGGGICLSASNPNLFNVVISNNSASNGGGVSCSNCSPNLRNVTISENTVSSDSSGGIFCDFSSNPNLMNSILWNNSPYEICLLNSSITIEYTNVKEGETGILSYNGTINWLDGNIDAAPQFVDTTNGNYQLQPTSPCINAGNPDTTGLGLPPMDLAGNPRIYEGTVAIIDMGAYEYQGEPQGEIYANITLNQGWTWFSVNVLTDSMTLNNVLSSLTPVEGDLIKNQIGFSTYFSSFGWWGDLDSLYCKEMYMIKLVEADTLKFSGAECEIIPIPLNEGWTWIGYLPQVSIAIGDALSSLSSIKDDLIKNQYEFSTFYRLLGWFGDLNNLKPHDGYKIKLASTDTLLYPEGVGKIAVEPIAQINGTSDISQTKWSVTPSDYANTMTMTAQLSIDDEIVNDTEYIVGVFAGEECRGIGKPIYFPPNNVYVIPLTIYSNEEEETLTFKAMNSAGIIINIKNACVSCAFQADNNIGNALSPFMLNGSVSEPEETSGLPKEFALYNNYPNPFNPETNIKFQTPKAAFVTLEIYNITGQLIKSLASEDFPAGIHHIIWDGTSTSGVQVSSGVYLYKIEAGGFSAIKKMILLK